MTVAHQDLEAANCQVCSVDDYLACDDENEELEERKLLQNLGRTTPNHLVQKQVRLPTLFTAFAFFLLQ